MPSCGCRETVKMGILGAHVTIPPKPARPFFPRSYHTGRQSLPSRVWRQGFDRRGHCKELTRP